MTRIVGIHGVGNFHPFNTAEAMSAIWSARVREPLGLPPERLELSVAYYSPALRGSIHQGSTGATDDVDVTVHQMIQAWLEQLGVPTSIQQGRGTAFLRQALEWVAQNFGLDNGLVRRFVAVFFREVATYLDDDRRSARDDALTIVTDTLASSRPRVVIAHSLGSILAYEALHARPDLQIDLLLTLGSPLAMPGVVYERLRPSPLSQRATRPVAAKNWINLADPGDLIAIPRKLSNHFDGIQADLETSIHAFDFHKVKHYLSNPTTAATLIPYLAE